MVDALESGADVDAVRADVRALLTGSLRTLWLGRPDPGVSGSAPEGAVITTSGSTGVPKSVVVSTDALRSSARATADRIGAGAWVLALPPTYVAGLQVIVRSLLAGHEPVAVAGRFSAAGFAAAARELPRGTPAYTSLVPAQLDTLLTAAQSDPALADLLARFDGVLVGGQAIVPELAERAAAADVAVVRTYGSTETAGGCVYDGVPLDGVRVRVVNGELQLSGPMLADGYLAEPDRTTASFPEDQHRRRWYRTGDTGSYSDGIVRVLGRVDNVIVSGGINISLDRVEQAVRSVPGLTHAVVVAVPDHRWGQASVIVTAPDPGPDDAARLLERARAAVAGSVGRHARPVRLITRERLPLLASGKPDRAALRAIVAE